MNYVSLWVARNRLPARRAQSKKYLTAYDKLHPIGKGVIVV